MRKVKFKMWIPKEHVNGDRHITIAGTGCFQADYLTTGVQIIRLLNRKHFS